MMGELAASVSHELKQPIAAAITDAKTSLRWLERDQPDVEEAREAIMRTMKDGTRAAEIIDRLRSFYKKGASPEREFVDVNELVREMLVLLRSEANRYSIGVRTDLATDLPKVTADRVQLRQVLMNLMLNGIEAMKDTPGELEIKSELDQDGQLLISVSDTGVGLPAEKTDHIFKAFFTTKPQGSGMGLAPYPASEVDQHLGCFAEAEVHSDWLSDCLAREDALTRRFVGLKRIRIEDNECSKKTIELEESSVFAPDVDSLR
jgi:signal transduction histidine kinase